MRAFVARCGLRVEGDSCPGCVWWVGWRKLLLLASTFSLAARVSVEADSLASGSCCSRQTQNIEFTTTYRT